MHLIMTVDGERVCKMRVFDDLVPHIAAALEEQLPQKGILQHGKIVGDMVFWTMPIVAPWENVYLTEEVGALRKAEKGYARGSVCWYSPRQQFCVVYGDDLADEPLKISYIGEVVEGELELALVGHKNWLQQGQIVELSIDS
ncbi:MAG: hypothetical protein JWP75_3923 [Frondihabitans sp.]|nr:hypothetical protein [Frondihabitans sp.]